MKRFSVEQYQRMRARVDDGRIACGSEAHCAVMDFERRLSDLPRREQKIMELALRGWTHVTIADQFGLSRSRVSHIIADFMLVELYDVDVV